MDLPAAVDSTMVEPGRPGPRSQVLGGKLFSMNGASLMGFAA
jgi:hypothetical protein